MFDDHLTDGQDITLFTPVSDEEADLLERGVALAGQLFWVDSLQRDEAQDDAVWVAMTIRRRLVAAFERPSSETLGYREFELPAHVPASHAVRRLSS